MTPNSKLNGLQALRFLAAMLVVWAHAVDTSQRLGFHALLATGTLENIGAIGVDIFFVISGFIITKSVRNSPSVASFWRSRILRVAPIYWLMSLPWIALSLRGSGFHVETAISTFFFWPTIGNFNEPYLAVGWTLCFEMLFYFAMGLAKLGVRPVWLLAAFALAALGRLVVNAAPLQFLGNPIIGEFLFGVLIAQLPTKRFGWTAAALAAIGIGANLWLGYGRIDDAHVVENASQSLHRLLAWGVPSACLVFAVARLEWLFRNRLGRVLAALGDASYAIYLTHGLVLRSEENVGAHVSLESGDLVILSSLVLSAVFGMAVFRGVEKPLLQRLRSGLFSAGQKFDASEPGEAAASPAAE